MPPGRDDPRVLIRYGVAVTAAALVLLWAAYLATTVLLLIYISSLLAMGFWPVVRFLEERLHFGTRHVPRWLAVLTIYLAILGTLTGLGFLIVPPVVEQARELAAEAPGMLDDAQDYLIDLGVLDRRMTPREAVEKAPADVDLAGEAVTAVFGVIGGIVGLLTMLILTFYVLLDPQPIFRALLALFPRERRPEAARVSALIASRVSAWLVGQLIIAGIVGTLTGVGLWLMGVPYFFVLAVIAAVGEVIPVIGPVLAAVPAIGLALTDSFRLALFVALFYLGLQQFESQVLTPKVMAARLGIGAPAVLVSLLVGHALFGFAGAILAIPSAAIATVLFQELVLKHAD